MRRSSKVAQAPPEAADVAKGPIEERQVARHGKICTTAEQSALTAAAHRLLTERLCTEFALERDGANLSLLFAGNNVERPSLAEALQSLPRMATLDDATAHASGLLRMHPQLSLDECITLVLYTSQGPSELINDALHSGHDEWRTRVAPWRKFILLLLHAMAKLPACPLTAVTFGSAKKGHAAAAAADMTPGAEFTYAGFVSGSARSTTSFGQRFLGSDTATGTLWRLELRSPIARDLSDFTVTPSTECEVLLPPGVSFEVLSVTTRDSLTIVSCRQSDEESLLDLLVSTADKAATATASAPTAAAAPAAAPTAAAAPLVSEAELATVGLSRELVERYEGGEECAFWFILAAELRALPTDQLVTLPKLQSLRTSERRSWLVQKTIRFVDLCAGAYRREYLTISHRWETPDQPDPTGAQLAAIQQHLQLHTSIVYVWLGAILLDAPPPRP